MTLSANQAAKEAGKTKKTILDAIKSKRMSASKNDKGHWEIDPSELFRVFPKTSKIPVSNTTTIPPLKNHDTSVLEVELNAERDMRTRLEAEIDDLKAQRDEWMNQAKQLALPKPATDNTPVGQGGKRGLWGRLFG